MSNEWAAFLALPAAQQITVSMAAMADVVAEAGPEYVYRPECETCSYVAGPSCECNDPVNPMHRVCSYVELRDDVECPSCLIARVLGRLGVSLAQLRDMDHLPEGTDGAGLSRGDTINARNLYHMPAHAELSWQVCAVWDQAQRAQDGRMAPWGVALAAAQREADYQLSQLAT